MVRPARLYRKHRKLLMESGIGVRIPGQAMRVLALLVESGMSYILIGVSFALVYEHRLSRSFPFQVASLASIIISLHFGLTNITIIFMLVAIQFVVRKTF